jgi:hypothetical protein
MRNRCDLEENVAATDWKLTPEIKAEIDRFFEVKSGPTYLDRQQALWATQSVPNRQEPHQRSSCLVCHRYPTQDAIGATRRCCDNSRTNTMPATPSATAATRNSPNVAITTASAPPLAVRRLLARIIKWTIMMPHCIEMVYPSPVQ